MTKVPPQFDGMLPLRTRVVGRIRLLIRPMMKLLLLLFRMIRLRRLGQYGRGGYKVLLVFRRRGVKRGFGKCGFVDRLLLLLGGYLCRLCLVIPR
jgi:hypothetical protein